MENRNPEGPSETTLYTATDTAPASPVHADLYAVGLDQVRRDCEGMARNMSGPGDR